MSVSMLIGRKSARKTLRSLIALAALASMSTMASASLIMVDSITTGVGMGTASTTTAPGGEKSSFFNTGTNYTVNFAGGSAPVTSITAGGQVYNIISPADSVTIRKNASNTKSPDNTMIWYQGSVTGNTINLKGTRQNSLSDALKQNDVYIGVDNLFSNNHGGNGDNTRSERLDVVFNGGVTASASKVFGVFERGKATGPNSHDPFKIAAITSVDAFGNPTSYGDVIAVDRGWGTASVLGSSINSIILRNSTGNPNLTSPAAIIPQPVGGVLIQTSDLVGDGVTIYGYSLFAYDVTGTGDQLLDWTNKNYFPTNTPHSEGGLDLLSITGLIQLQALPEPAMLSIAGLGLMGLLHRRRRTA